MTKASWSLYGIAAGFIMILDDNKPGHSSVTNDAENVCRDVVARHGNHRIIYRDTMGRWDELAHDAGRFIGFKPMPACFKPIPFA